MVQLFMEATVGIAVLVRCFVNKKGMETEIIDRLGNGFSRAPFATVVVHPLPNALKLMCYFVILIFVST